ncbi:MAG: hypothetical protein PHI60_03615 [Candidatus Omnitrophica bacterium]|nr:hypothetical protein [Candidatus Omnitrophota bacterium]
MRKNAFLLFAVCALFLAPAWCQESGEIPPGMEKKLIGTTEMIVPKGMQFRKEGDALVLETAPEYVARRLLEQDKRLEKMEQRFEEFSWKIEELNIFLEGIRQKISEQTEKQ